MLKLRVGLSNLGMMSSSDVKKGDFQCKKAALLFARGTGEPGNMGYVVGPGLGTGLKKGLNGDILIQGVDYSSEYMTCLRHTSTPLIHDSQLLWWRRERNGGPRQINLVEMPRNPNHT